MTHRAPVADPRTVEAYARELVAKPGHSRVLVLAADPAYRGPDRVPVDGIDVHVHGCVSSLAVREALLDLPDDGYAILLTDRPVEDLGDALVARFRRQRVEPLDAWATVPGLFRARHVDSGLRHAMPWLPDLLFARLPAHGYPPSPTELVTAEHVLAALTHEILGLDLDELGVSALLDQLGDPAVRAAWAGLDDPARESITAWVQARAGAAAGAVLTLAAAPATAHVHVLALGLMLDVLYGPAGLGMEDARRGWENGYRLPRIDPSAATQVGQSARLRMRLLGDVDPAARHDVWRDTPEAFAIAAYPAGVARSLNHPDGYRARLAGVATVLQTSLVTLADPEPGQSPARTAPESRASGLPAALPALERAAADLHDHDLAWTDQQDETARAGMAVRLARWLSADPDVAPATLGAALARQAAGDAWVDRAVADVWSGSTFDEPARAYQALCARVLAVRTEHDRQFAALLAEATTRDVLDPGLLPVERVLADVVDPLARVAPVLLVVVDGMSTGVGAAIAEGINRLAWAEHVPTGGPGTRAAVLAALPTLTRFSRTSLLCGQLREGTQVDEKRQFAALTGGPVFHKDDLRAPAGAAVSPQVADAIAGAGRIVGVVLNTVDDTLAKHDPDGTRWSVAAIQHLEALLELARRHGRTVVITSDHGHVVERGGRAEPRAGAEARWRPTVSGPAGDGEVTLAGPRVLAPGGAVIAAWAEDLRYGRKAAGYHGGAAAAEVTIPLLVFAGPRVDLRPAGWVPAGGQSPAWWDHPLPPLTPAGPTPAPARPRRPRPPAPPADQALFDLPAPAPVASPAEPVGAADGRRAAEIAQFATSATYQRMRQAAGRGALPDLAVRQVLDHLLAGDGRAAVDVIARAVGIPVTRLPLAMSGLRRLLNVEGYPVVSLDPDGRTVVLDVPLWRAQFGVR